MIKRIAVLISLLLFLSNTFADQTSNKAYPDLLNDKDILMAAVATYPDALRYASNPLKSDKELVLTAVTSPYGDTSTHRGQIITYADKSLQQDKELIISAVSAFGNTLHYIDPSFRKDKAIIKAAILHNPWAALPLDPILQNDKDLAFLAIQKDRSIIHAFSSVIRKNQQLIASVFPEYKGKNYHQFVLAQLKTNPHIYTQLSKELKKDKSIGLATIRSNSFMFSSLAESLKDNKEVALAAVKQSGFELNNVSGRLKKDRDIVLAAIQQTSLANDYVDPHFRDDREVVHTMIKQSASALKFASPRLRKDRELVLLAMQKDSGHYSALKFADKTLQNDREVVRTALKATFHAYRYASESLRADKQLLLEALSYDDDSYASIIEYASSTLRNDPDILEAAERLNQKKSSAMNQVITHSKDKKVVLKAVQGNGLLLQYADDSLKSDKQVVLAAIKADGFALEYADTHLKKDKTFALAAVKQGAPLKFLHKSLQQDKQIILAAIHYEYVDLSSLFKSLDTTQKSDKDILLALLNQPYVNIQHLNLPPIKHPAIIDILINKHAKYIDVLKYSDSSFRNNRKLITKLLKKGGSLRYASDEIKKDKAFMLSSVKQDGLQLRYADKSLQKDQSIVLAAINNNPLAYQYADHSLQVQKHILLAAVKLKGEMIKYYPSPHPQSWQTTNANYVIQRIPLGATDPSFDEVVISPDKTKLATLFPVEGDTTGVMIWRTSDGQLIHQTTIPKSGYSNLFFSPDSQRLISLAQGSDDFIWDFTQQKEPRICFMGSSLLDITTQPPSILVNPVDDRYKLYDLNTCEEIVIAPGSNINPPEPPNPVISADNKLLMMTLKPLDKEFREELLYLRPTRVFSSPPIKAYQNKMDLWELPLSAEDQASSYFDIDKKHHRILTFTPKKNSLLLKQWDYNRKKMLSKKLIPGLQGTLSRAIVNHDLQKIFLYDQAGVTIASYTGDIKRISYPENSIAKTWNEEQKQFVNQCYPDACQVTFSNDGGKLILQDKKTQSFEIISLLDGHLLRSFAPFKTDTGKQFLTTSCFNRAPYSSPSTLTLPCIFEMNKSILKPIDPLSDNADFLIAPTETLDPIAEESIIKLNTATFIKTGVDENNETVLISRSLDKRKLTLWKIKRVKYNP